MFFKCLKSGRRVERFEVEERRASQLDVIKILLLGTGEAGKTTIMKQMKILHIRSYTESEKRNEIQGIYQTLHECIYGLVTSIPTWFIPDKKLTKESISYILALSNTGPATYNDEYFNHVRNIWENPSIQNICRTFRHPEIIDCAKYFLNRLDLISQNDYIPNEQDILRSKSKTTETKPLTFRMHLPRSYGKLFQEFCMYDVGGQRAERKKWIQVFAGVHAIIFVVSCSEFDQTLRENGNVNRLEESLNLFSEVWTSRFLLYAGFVLFLNKQDILKEKIENGVSIAKYFPEYGEEMKMYNGYTEYEKVRIFIKNKFMMIANTRRDLKIQDTIGHRLSQHRPCQELFCHFTVATNTVMIKSVFKDVHTTILNKMLTEFVIL